ncbi:MAG: hypothetical protein AAFR61_15320 [Bacteroidota bacterium]
MSKKEKRREINPKTEVKAKGLVQIVDAKDIPEARIRMSLTLASILILSVITSTTFVVTKYITMTNALSSLNKELADIREELTALQNKKSTKSLESRSQEIKATSLASTTVIPEKEVDSKLSTRTFQNRDYGISQNSNLLKYQIDSIRLLQQIDSLNYLLKMLQQK